MMRVLVTGGAGFIGSHLTDRLLAEGHEVLVVDDLSTGKQSNLRAAQAVKPRAAELRVLDITSPALGDVIGEFRPAVVFHLAAQMDVRRSVADPVHDAQTNVVGTVRLLESCRHAGVDKVVFATSGGCVYGEPAEDELPVAETYRGHPHSPYGTAKLAAEEYLHTYEILYGLRWTSLALGNVFGPRQDPAGEAGVVSIFGGRMLRGEDVTVYGDGEQSRDFVAVGDVVEAFVRAIDAGDGLRVNIGTGEATTVNSLVSLLAELTGYDREPVHAPERSGELRHIALDIRRAQQELAWKPSLDLRAGLEQTLQWLAEDEGAAGSSGR